MKIERVYSCLFLLGLCMVIPIKDMQAQTSNVFSNSGVFYVSPGTQIGVVSEFVNESPKAQDMFENNGSISFFNDFTNLGVFDYDHKLNSGEVYFSKEISEMAIKGADNPTLFNQVYFESEFNISLENAISVGKTAFFNKGLLYVNKDSGSITFLENSTHQGAGDHTHVVGFVEKQGDGFFTMPIGNGSYYRSMSLVQDQKSKDIFAAKYVYENPILGREGKSPGIITVDNAEYWELDTSSADGRVIISLTWNEATTPREIYEKAAQDNLSVLWWDQTNGVWVDEGGAVDMANKTVTSTTETKAKGIFTLGVVNQDGGPDQDDQVIIYNGVTPNGDGHNDYFIIKNIHKYPNNSVEVVNRWGNTVFSTTNYDRNGDGSDNVFAGQAKGKGVNASGKLPSGTYFYIVKYEYTDKNGTRWIKKAGYLNLENN
ncbi:gliding motility-associated C-terminal domain-containing protein [Myroides sp. LJL119]